MSAGASRLAVALLLFLSTLAAGAFLKNSGFARRPTAAGSASVRGLRDESGLPLPAVALPAKRAAASARIRTDKRTYFPGQIVAITGSGWEPGETVSLLVHETSSRDPDVLFFATADAAGNIFNDQFSPDPVSATTTFALTARGQSSELQAQTTFAHKRAPSETRISPRAARPADRPAKEDALISDQLSSRP